MYTTHHTFERTELRVIRAGCVDDEEFLNKVATIIGDLTEKRDAEKLRADMAELCTNILLSQKFSDH